MDDLQQAIKRLNLATISNVKPIVQSIIALEQPEVLLDGMKSLSECLARLYLIDALQHKAESSELQRLLKDRIIPRVEEATIVSLRLPSDTVTKYTRTIQSMVSGWEKKQFISQNLLMALREQTEGRFSRKRVYLWDLDETLLIFDTLTDGTFAKHTNKSVDQGTELGERMVQTIFKVLDNHLFFQDLDPKDIVHLQDIASFDDGRDLTGYQFKELPRLGPQRMIRLAYRYRVIEKIYTGQNSGPSLDEWKQIQELVDAIDAFTDGWISTARSVLKTLNDDDDSAVHLIVTNSQLVPALCKCILYRFNQMIPAQNVYSSAHVGKRACFKRIMESFGSAEYIVVGNGPEEEEAAHDLSLDFIQVLL